MPAGVVSAARIDASRTTTMTPPSSAYRAGTRRGHESPGPPECFMAAEYKGVPCVLLNATIKKPMPLNSLPMTRRPAYSAISGLPAAGRP
jgi:hypothetical protein